MTILSCYTYFFVISLLIGATTTNSKDLKSTIKNVISNFTVSLANFKTDFVEKSAMIFPTPNAVFNAGMHTVVTYSTAVILNAINKLCPTINSIIKSQITPDINKMAFQLMTPCKNYSIPILQAKDLWNHPAFDRTKKVVILATGFKTNVSNAEPIYYIGKAYFCRGDVNFIGIDAAKFVNTLYFWAALNTDKIGLHISTGLVDLAKIVNPKNIHLIGHSLGAHIVGSAGRNFYYKTGKMIGRITGLDPARPCFSEDYKLSGLQRGDADLVDVIHSNNGVLGKRDPTGDIDFYPGGLGPLQPGCDTPVCAHSRAYKYYAETVYPGNENNFMGVRCGSLTALRKKECPGKAVRMGYGVPVGAKGNYFLEVNGKKPFGKFASKETAEQVKCGLCPINIKSSSTFH